MYVQIWEFLAGSEARERDVVHHPGLSIAVGIWARDGVRVDGCWASFMHWELIL